MSVQVKICGLTSRAAADGLVGVSVQGNSGALVEVNAETDFVARNDEFIRTERGLDAQIGRLK